MKRLLKFVICVCVSMFFAFGLTACGDGTSENEVNLVAIDSNSVGTGSYTPLTLPTNSLV